MADPKDERIAALTAAVRAMLEPQPVVYTPTNRLPLCGRCFVLGQWNGSRHEFEHEPDCAVVAAEALLAEMQSAPSSAR